MGDPPCWLSYLSLKYAVAYTLREDESKDYGILGGTVLFFDIVKTYLSKAAESFDKRKNQINDIVNKSTLRQEFLKKRQTLSDEAIREKNLLVADKTLGLLENLEFKTIHCFLSQRKKNEVDTRLILDSVPETSIIAVPYVIPGKQRMEHYIFNSDTILIENRWGIPEPDPLTSIKIEPQLIDVVLIPLLCFDISGFRIGYGGGFYDRFLAECRDDTVKIGLSFFDPIEEIEDMDQYDVRMDYCVTPGEVWRWKNL